MSSRTEELDRHATDCMKLAQAPHLPPELREQLLLTARAWLQGVMEEHERNAEIAVPVWQPPAPPC